MIKLGKVIPTGISLLAALAIPLSLTVSCSSKAPNVLEAVNGDWNENYAKGTSSIDRSDNTKYILHGVVSGFGDDIILKDVCYNKFYDEVNLAKDTVGIAVIANHKVYTDIVKIQDHETVADALDSSRFIFKRFMHQSMGAFLNSFATKDAPSVYMHGTRTQTNYGDYYPMYYINRSFAQLGVTNYHLSGDEVLEFSFDNK